MAREVVETDLGTLAAVLGILAFVMVLVDTLVLIGAVSALGRLSRAFQTQQNELDSRASLVAPQFSAVDMDGNQVDNQSLSRGLTALLFVSTTCPSCSATLIEMQALKHRARDGIVVVCQASPVACAGLVDSLGIQTRVIADEAGALGRLFGVDTVPFAVVLSSGTHIKSRGYPLREHLEEAASNHEEVRDG